MMRTRAQALLELSELLGRELSISAALSPEDAARRAWHPGGPSVEQLSERIARNRASLTAVAV